MRIGFFCNEYPPALHGGIGSFTRDLSRGLVDRGIGVAVFGFYDLKTLKDPETEIFRDGEIPVVRKELKQVGVGPRFDLVWNRLRARSFAEEMVEKFDLDLIETPDSAGWFPVGLRGRAPLVTRLHGGVAYNGRELGRRYSRIQGYFERRQIDRSHMVIAVSNYVGKQTMRIFSQRKPFRVIHNSISDTCVRFSEGAALNTRFSGEDDIILFSGSVIPRKGVEPLMKAANQIFSTRPSAKLFLVGKNQRVVDGRAYEGILRSLVDQSYQDRIEFLGHLDRETGLYPLIQRASVCVFPSYSEAFALAPLEAMAMGKAVVVSDRTSGPEAVRNGETGLLIDPDDTLELAKAIGVLLDRPSQREKLGKAAREEISRRFGYSKWITENIGCFEECLRESPSDSRFR